MTSLGALKMLDTEMTKKRVYMKQNDWSVIMRV